MSIKCDGTDIAEVNYNGTNIDAVYVNNVNIWNRVLYEDFGYAYSEDIYVDDFPTIIRIPIATIEEIPDVTKIHLKRIEYSNYNSSSGKNIMHDQTKWFFKYSTKKITINNPRIIGFSQGTGREYNVIFANFTYDTCSKETITQTYDSSLLSVTIQYYIY